MWLVRAPSALAIALAATSCAPTASRPPGAPPTPLSVTKDEPGGDASDPQRAALERLLERPWGLTADREQTLKVHLPDVGLWRRVRIIGYPTRAAFRYGEDHYALDVVLYTDADGDGSPSSCVDGLMAEAEQLAIDHHGDFRPGPREELAFTLVTPDQMDAPFGDMHHVRTERFVLVRGDGAIRGLFGTERYVGAAVAYPSWPGTCLVQVFLVIATEHRDLATRVRDRWVDEAAGKLRWKRRVQSAPPRTAR